MSLEWVLSAVICLNLAAAFVLSLVAVRGFWSAPFGDVLRPLPIAFGGFLLGVAPGVMGVSSPLSYQVLTATGAILAAFVAAAEGVVLLGGWRTV